MSGVSDLEIIVGLGMLLGLVGVLIPILPGLPSIVAAGLAWAVFGDVGAAGWIVALMIAGIGLAGMLVASILPAKRTLESGVPPWVLAVAATGVVIGFFVIPVVGALVGGPVALFVAEVVRHRDIREAWRTTKEALVAIGIGVGVQLGAGVAMIAVWLVGVALT